jgi:hypothetical protein
MTDPVEKFPRFRLGALTVDETKSSELAAKEDVVRHGQLVHKVELLMNHHDTQLHRLQNRVKPDSTPVDLKLARRGLFHAREYLHERAFAGTVFTHESVNFSAPELKVHSLESAHSTKFLGKIFDSDNRRRGQVKSL